MDFRDRLNTTLDKISLRKYSKSQQFQDEMFSRMKEKLKTFEIKANQGDVDTQERLIKIYNGDFRTLARSTYSKDDGEGVKSINFLAIELVNDKLKSEIIDKRKAFEWVKVLSESGHKSAQLWICDYYIDGIGGNANDGIACYKNLYKEGYPSCAYSLAKIYHYGKGSVTKNLAEAAKWYKKASDEGFGHHEEAKYELALMYLEGKGVQQDQNKAIELFKELYEANPTGYWGCGAGEMLESIKNNNSQEAEAEQGDSFWSYLLIGFVVYFVIKTMYPY